MSTVYMLVGNIGTGKSIIARKLSMNGCIVVSMDNIQSSMHGGCYGMYDISCKDVYRSVERELITSCLKQNKDIVIDRTLVQKERRNGFIDLVSEYTNDIVCYDFGCGDENSLRRRVGDSRGVPVSIWESVHKFLMDNYEEPSKEEGFEIINKWYPKRYTMYKFDFDGTLVINAFPNIGELITGDVAERHGTLDCVGILRNAWKDFSNIVIIETSRSGDLEDQVRQFLHNNGIPYDFINDNPLFDTGSRKLFAHYCYDDRNVSIYRKGFEDKIEESPINSSYKKGDKYFL
ncbi:MAG: ATP-binding protein [bacterium]|nr:ATP-binding protein [bacterium]